MIGLGVECTAHTLGIGIVKDSNIVANEKDAYTTKQGGIIPLDASRHHENIFLEVLEKALRRTKIKLEDLDFISVSIGPGLAPCLLSGLKKTKHLCKEYNLPLIPVNHCVAHLEIGKITKAKNPVMLYVSGANTQIIAYASGKYRVFGETLDIGIGNFIDTFGRYAKIGFPAGYLIEKLALKAKKYIELPYKVKGMDVAFSGILTNLRQKLEKIGSLMPVVGDSETGSAKSLRENSINEKTFLNNYVLTERRDEVQREVLNERAESEQKYTLADLAYSMQETVFAMLVESAERALAHTGKNELLLGGGVACNSRLQEMCKIMCKERGAKFFCPENSLLVDNGAMIAYLGEIMFRKSVKENNLDKVDIKPRQRTDEVNVGWR